MPNKEADLLPQFMECQMSSFPSHIDTVTKSIDEVTKIIFCIFDFITKSLSFNSLLTSFY